MPDATHDQRNHSSSHWNSLIPPGARAVSLDAAAQALGLSRRSIYRLIKAGRLRSVKVLDRNLIPVTAIDELLAG
jgi:excisionase family DNA binding protein